MPKHTKAERKKNKDRKAGETASFHGVRIKLNPKGLLKAVTKRQKEIDKIK